MAPIPRFLVILLPILALLTPLARIWLCKTLIFSSYSLSIKLLYPNPNPNHEDFSSFLTIVVEISQDCATLHPFSTAEQDLHRKNRPLVHPGLPFPGVSPRDVTSFHDRARDIIGIVAILLFGIGCGVLTASTMYLVWSLFSSHEEEVFDE